MLYIKKWFLPFEKTDTFNRILIVGFWVILVLASWYFGTLGEKKLFPSPPQVWEGLSSLYKEGLMLHVLASLGLCLQATAISICVSLFVVYLSPVPLIKPIARFLSQLRYLPLTGITFYLAIIVTQARTMQVWVLVIFMSLYFITSLLGILKDIPQEEIDHAKSLKCNRWEVLWEVVVKSRLDYVFEVLRQNLAITWMMLVTVESILVAAGGLGMLIKNSDRFMNHGRILALQIVILIVGLLLDWLLTSARKMFFRYSNF